MRRLRKSANALKLISALLALVCAAPASLAADPPPIVVTAIPRDPVTLKHEVASYVRKIAEVSDQDQYARWTASFCPKVIGLDPDYAALVLSRVRDAAAATGRLTEAPQGCPTNLAIIFSNDGDALVTALNRRQPELFVALQAPKRREIFNSGRAVRWWYGIHEEGTDGQQIAEGNLKVPTASLITTNLRISLGATIVIVDANKADGFPLDAIASYAAMVSFAQIKGDDGGLTALHSVLGMFARPGARRDAVSELTPWDRAYLHGLYQIALDRPAWQQRNAVAGAMLIAAKAQN